MSPQLNLYNVKKAVDPQLLEAYIRLKSTTQHLSNVDKFWETLAETTDTKYAINQDFHKLNIHWEILRLFFFFSSNPIFFFFKKREGGTHLYYLISPLFSWRLNTEFVQKFNLKHSVSSWLGKSYWDMFFGKLVYSDA